MKLVLTLLVRDEQDILRANIEYHLAAGVDFIIATDNRSVDGTKDILMEYAARGCLHYIFEEQDNYAQYAWVSRMVAMATETFGADWIINSDADEFWWSEPSGGLKAVLAAAPEHVLGFNVDRHNFVPLRQLNGAGFIPAMRYRQTCSLNTLGKPLPSKACHRAVPGITVSQGNHHIFLDGTMLELDTAGSMCIFHYPLRTPEQFTAKIAHGGAASERDPASTVETWRALLETYQREGLDRFFASRLYDDKRLAEDLASGEIVEDTRLYDFFVERGLPL